MKAFFPLWRRELAGYFRTTTGYVIGVFFLLVTGASFWLLASRLAHGATDGDLASTLFTSPGYWLAMLVVTPLLTMRLFAEERRMDTLEALMTAPVTETEVVLAKFAGAYCAFLLLWAPTGAYVLLLDRCGAQFPALDWGAVAGGYLGTALLGASFLSLGLLCSLLTRHQIVAAMGCLALLGLKLSLGWMPLPSHLHRLQRFAPLFSAPLHMADFGSGIVDTRAVVWYISSTVLLLFGSIRILEARRLR
jgi:ABC-2 type transport system permease protein